MNTATYLLVITVLTGDLPLFQLRDDLQGDVLPTVTAHLYFALYGGIPVVFHSVVRSAEHHDKIIIYSPSFFMVIYVIL